MILYTDNQSDNAVVTSPESNIFKPPANVKDSRLSRIFEGAEQTSLQIAGSGALKNISQAYTNAVSAPVDLTATGWVDASVGTAVLSSDTINNHNFTELTCTGSSYTRDYTFAGGYFSNTQVLVYGIIRKGFGTGAKRIIFAEGAVSKLEMSPNFTTKTVSASVGTILKYTFLDDITVQVWGITDIYNTAVVTEVRAFVGGASESASFTEIMVIDDNLGTMYPFVNGTHSADVIDETFTMPDRFTLRIKFTPNYKPSPPALKAISTWQIDSLNELLIYYNHNTNKFVLHWEEDSVVSSLSSGVFDDGTLYTNLNQPLDMIFSLDFVNNTMRFVIMLQSGKILDANAGSIPNKLKNYPTLDIGVRGGVTQADSTFEYLKISEGLLTGDVLTSEGVDELLKDKKVLLDKTYQQKLTATDLLIANSTINDGDTVILQGNDVDSWGTGTPLYETVDWSKKITQHNFTKSTYQYYRIFVNSSNTVSIGRVYLGTRLIPPELSPTLTHNRISASQKSRTISGQTNQDSRFFYSTVDVSYPAVTKAQKAELIEMFESVDVGTPFFVEFNETCLDLGTLYATLDQDSLSFDLLGNTDYYSVGLGIIEEV
ncbi:MAG: hypothetical protein GY797_36985 [Deltaproteobacteria bacterium]|nr:hypothetical protein [Deltaproteobacteria bacterium]